MMSRLDADHDTVRGLTRERIAKSPLGPKLVHACQPLLSDASALTDDDVVQFWQHGRRLFERWEFILVSAVEAADRSGQLKPEAIETVTHNIEAVLSSEPALRAWIAIVCEFDNRYQKTYRPLVLRSYETLLAARLASLRVLTHSAAMPTPVVANLDALRRRAERRTDWMLAALASHVDWQPFAISPPRVQDFSIDATRIGAEVAQTALSLQPIATSSLSGPLLKTIERPIDRVLGR